MLDFATAVRKMRGQDMLEAQVQIQPAAVSDLPEIASLASVIWRAVYPGIISKAQIDFMLGWMYSLETLRCEMQTQGVRFERLLVAGRLAGFAACGPAGEPGVYKLHKLYLHPEQQGCGLGSRLLTHCEREAARLGARRMILSVNKRNEQAIRVYRRNGYDVVDSVVVDIGGGFFMDDFVMAKSPLDRPIDPTG